MGQYRTAQGKSIDMAALAAKNERVRAVGNMKVNARGDTIDANGKVLLPVTQKVGEKYQNTVGNRSAHVKPKTQQAQAQAPKQQLTKDEMDLESSFDDDLEVEKIKAKENKK
jgi:hypothetical protein